MSYATLLVYVNVDRVSKQLVSVAAGLADKFSAKLIGLSALAIVPPFAAEGVVFVDNATEVDTAVMKARLGEAGDEFRAAAGADRQTEWRSFLEFPTQSLLSEARCADLIVVEKNRASWDIHRVTDNGLAILGAGRPFLVVPTAVKSLAAEHVVVGWKDTGESRRAVQDALPFLHEAKRITIVKSARRIKWKPRAIMSMTLWIIWPGIGLRPKLASKRSCLDQPERIRSSASPWTKGPICW